VIARGVKNMRKKLNIQIILFVCTVILFLLSRDFPHLYHATQQEYYTHALERSDQILLKNDWFAQTQPKHIGFSSLMELLYRLNIIEAGTHIIETILEAIFYVSIFMISESLFTLLQERNNLSRYHHKKLLSGIVVIIYLIIKDSGLVHGIVNRVGSNSIELWKQFDYGLALQTLNSGYLQPSEFGIFILLAFALALKHRWYFATLALVISVNFHFSYLIHCGILLLIFVSWLCSQKKYSVAIYIILIFGVSIIPVTLYAAGFLSDPFSETAKKLFASVIFPFQGIPSVFMKRPGQVFKVFVMVAGILICVRFGFKFILTILMIGFLFVISGLLYVHFTENYSMALLFPWRASTYLVPLSLILIVIYFVAIVSTLSRHHLFSSLKLGHIMMLLFIVTVFVQIIVFTKWRILSSSEQNIITYEKISQATKASDIIMIPLRPDNYSYWGDARLLMKRAVYVDYGSVPMLGRDILEWQSRTQFVKLFYEASLEEQLLLCKEAGVQYFVVEADENSIIEEAILHSQEFYLIPCE